MQLRRVLLLFALVLGLSAVVASLAPPPEEETGSDDSPVATTPSAGRPEPDARTESVRFEAPDPDDESFKTLTRAVPAGSSLSVEVAVPEPGDIAIDGLGLRRSADPLAPARFELLAEPEGRYAILYFPATGDTRLIGRLEFR